MRKLEETLSPWSRPLSLKLEVLQVRKHGPVGVFGPKDGSPGPKKWEIGMKSTHSVGISGDDVN